VYAARATNALGTDCFSKALRATEVAERETSMVETSGVNDRYANGGGGGGKAFDRKTKRCQRASTTVGWMGTNWP
jgi:hypothetical protein